MTRMQRTKLALAVSTKFEGSDPFANITGDFDDAGLTCGALGWTMRWDNQDPLVNAFISRHGLSALKTFMPKTWGEYYKIIQAPESSALKMVEHWSNGSSTVKEPYRSELRAFWRSPEMQEIQVEQADKDMGKYAEEYSEKFCTALGKPPQEGVPQFIFNWFFDVKVHNGGMKGIALNAGNSVTIQQIRSWCDALVIPANFRSTKTDLDRNVAIWEKMWPTMTKVEKALLGLSWVRCQLSVSSFRADTMNRKGALAAGVGYVHGSKYTFSNDDYVAEDPLTQEPKPPVLQPGTGVVSSPSVDPRTEETQVRDALKRGFSGILSANQIEDMIERQKADRPGKWPTYWGVCQFGLHSSKHRFHSLNRKTGERLSTLCAHGIGSEGATDDGMADVFSNRSGSEASSLGLYRVAETYYGKHGNSCRIDGLEPTNSNARERSVVIHGADYVSEATVRKSGRSGRSQGCFALPNDQVQTFISQLKGGSLLLAVK